MASLGYKRPYALDIPSSYCWNTAHEGGVLFIGVADDGSLPGLGREDVARLNQMIGNAAAQHVRSPLTVQTQNIRLPGDRLVIVLTVPKGIDKPYFDKNGSIWLKSGADKRRVNSKEELRRLFQISDQFHADELPTKAGLDKLDNDRFGTFLWEVFKRKFHKGEADRLQILKNMNLATDTGALNLAGVLLFAKDPERIKPSFVVKAVAFPGTTITASVYDDSEDFSGPLPTLFQSSMSFIKRALDDWPDIIFTDDRDGCLFVSTVLRKPAVSGAGDALTGASAEGLKKTPLKTPLKTPPQTPLKTAGITLGKTPGGIIELLSSTPNLPIPEIALALSKSESAVKRAIRKLRENGRLRRIGPDKGGHWEIIQ
ncbi:MAG: putative DNA binding domain-containing protein [Kiritimatiellae bacterium]|nr:putative DNA binding domain-containing protein [Kiritimatiellia bacterium]